MNIESLNVFKSTAPDSLAILGGVWCTPEDKLGRPYEFMICVRPVTHPAYMAALELARSKHAEDIAVIDSKEEFERRSQEEQERLMRVKTECTAEAVARSILVDWKGIEDDEGPIEYTWENGRDLLAHPRMSEVADGVIRCAIDRMNFTEKARLQGLEILKKNYGTS